MFDRLLIYLFRQTCFRRQSTQAWPGDLDNEVWATFQYLVVCPWPMPYGPNVHAHFFSCFSGTCNAHIGMGVRYNAEKKKIGNYYSTPIFSFRCKCHLCSGWFEIQTDPKVCFRRRVLHPATLILTTSDLLEYSLCCSIRSKAEGRRLGSWGERRVCSTR